MMPLAHSMIDTYPIWWDYIAKRIKRRAGWKCEICGHKHDAENGYTLTVHHLIPIKSLCYDWNLAALCQRCHLKVQDRVSLLQIDLFLPQWLTPHIEGFLAWLNSDQDGVDIKAKLATARHRFLISD